MTLQARLTLWSIIFVAILVGIVSGIDVAQEIERQFDETEKQSRFIGQYVDEVAKRSAEMRLPALAASVEISSELLTSQHLMRTVSEIAVCSGDAIIADSLPDKISKPCPSFAPWFETVGKMRFLDRAVFLLNNNDTFVISDRLKVGGTATDSSPRAVTVRLLVQPALMRNELTPVLKDQASIAIGSVIGAMIAAFLFSSVAFRPLGKLGHMLDLITRGEYEIPAPGDIANKTTQDEFNAVASKVNLLGQKLQGAHAEFSDLRTNVERLLEELEDAVLIFARDRRLIAAVGSVERFLGRPRAELMNQTITEIFPGGTSLGLFLAQAMQTGRMIRNRRVPLSSNEDPANRDGISFALLSIEFLESSAAGGVLVRLRDPEATRQIGSRLQTADRLSAISGLTKGVAHEVKNPLNAMLMHVELARMKLAHGDYDLDPQMDVISTEIMRLDRVVKTFLDFTRPVELHLTDTKAGGFMEEIVGLARPQAQASGIEIVTNIDVGEGMITIDADLMKQAVLNIVVNAIDAMPNGGKLQFDVGPKGDDTEIRISDTGSGIPPEVKEKIYDLYFTTKQSGSGIGLAMTFRIVQLHDARIDFTSEPGMGTTFVLRLPTALA